jgi:hypothetical protein
VNDEQNIETPFRYHLELTPAQLKITHTALRSLLDDFGHDEPEIRVIVHELLAKLPDEHAIRAIQLDREASSAPSIEVVEAVEAEPTDDGGPPDAAA